MAVGTGGRAAQATLVPRHGERTGTFEDVGLKREQRWPKAKASGAKNGWRPAGRVPAGHHRPPAPSQRPARVAGHRHRRARPQHPSRGCRGPLAWRQSAQRNSLGRVQLPFPGLPGRCGGSHGDAGKQAWVGAFKVVCVILAAGPQPELALDQVRYWQSAATRPPGSAPDPLSDPPSDPSSDPPSHLRLMTNTTSAMTTTSKIGIHSPP